MSTSTDSNFVKQPAAVPEAGAYPVVAFLFLVLLCLTYSTNAADRQLFPTLLPSIRSHFGWDLKESGLLSTFFTLGLAVVGIPAGYLVDRVSRKVVIISGMLIYSAFTLTTIYAYGFWDMLIYRVVTGLGEGIQMAALFAVIGSYFHAKRSTFMGWMIVAYGLGAFLGPRAGVWMQASSGGNWQMPFIWFAIIGVVLAAIVWFTVPASFSESKGPQAKGAVDQAAIAYMPTNLWNRNVILAFIGSIICGFSLFGFLSLWSVYARDVLHFSGPDIGAAFSYFGIGGLLSFVAGWTADKWRHNLVIAVAFGFLAVIGYSMYNVATTPEGQSLLTFLTGVFGSGFAYTNLLTLLQRSVRPEMVGRASGLFLTSLFGAASIAGYLMGSMVAPFGWGGAAFVELTLFPVIGIVAMLLIDPTKLIQLGGKKA